MEKKATPSMVGTGTANYAAQLAELRRKQKDAALKGDFDKVDDLERQIQELYRKMHGGQ